MIKVTMIFDNSAASPMPSAEFVTDRYLTDLAKAELKAIKAEQGDYRIKGPALDDFLPKPRPEIRWCECSPSPGTVEGTDQCSECGGCTMPF